VEELSLNLPTMYGDHHVVEVRRLLLELPGVHDVYASSAFQVVDVAYEGQVLDSQRIRETLEAAGYVGELPVLVEKGSTEDRVNGDKPFFRHTTASAQTGKSVGFVQDVPYVGRPLWPCPGMGPIVDPEEALENG
jgi:copper chaperone CopZ